MQQGASDSCYCSVRKNDLHPSSPIPGLGFHGASFLVSCVDASLFNLTYLPGLEELCERRIVPSYWCRLSIRRPRVTRYLRDYFTVLALRLLDQVCTLGDPLSAVF